MSYYDGTNPGTYVWEEIDLPSAKETSTEKEKTDAVTDASKIQNIADSFDLSDILKDENKNINNPSTMSTNSN